MWISEHEVINDSDFVSAELKIYFEGANKEKQNITCLKLHLFLA